MTQNTVTGAVEKHKASAMAVTTSSRDWFASILPSHVDVRAFVSLANAHLKKNPRLAAAANQDPAGYMTALSECARLGLVPGDTFHILNFKSRDGWDFVGVVDYTGDIELIYRAGAVSSIKAEIVYERDQFRFTPDMERPEHVIDWFGGDRGDMVGVYAYAVMKDGATSRVVVMNKAEVMKVKAVSKTAGRSDSPWEQWEDRMWLKTSIHQLQKWVPTSTEWRREQLRAAVEADNERRPAAADTHPAAVQPGDPEYIDAEIVEDEPDPRDVGADPLTGQGEG